MALAGMAIILSLEFIAKIVRVKTF